MNVLEKHCFRRINPAACSSLFLCAVVFACGCCTGGLTASCSAAGFLAELVQKHWDAVRLHPFLWMAIWDLAIPIAAIAASRSIYGSVALIPFDLLFGFTFGFAVSAVWRSMDHLLALQIAMLLGIPSIPSGLLLLSYARNLSRGLRKSVNSDMCFRPDLHIWNCLIFVHSLAPTACLCVQMYSIT